MDHRPKCQIQNYKTSRKNLCGLELVEDFLAITQKDMIHKLAK